MPNFIAGTSFYVDADGAARIDKSPADVLDYSRDWTKWLTKAGITMAQVSAVNWTAEAGVTVQLRLTVGNVTPALISGGEAGKSYRVDCELVTNETPARKVTRSFYLDVKYAA